MKKLTLILLSCLLLSLFAPCSFAADAPDEAIAFAENYLRMYTKNLKTREENDLLADTVDALPDTDRQTILQAAKNCDDEFHECLLPTAEVFVGAEPNYASLGNLNDMPADEIIGSYSTFISDKIAYHKHLNEVDQIYCSDIEVGFQIDSIRNLDSGFIFINLSECITTIYLDTEVRNTYTNYFSICLYKIADRFVICNVHDFNDGLNLERGFDLQSRIQEVDNEYAGQLAQIKAENEVGQNTEDTAETNFLLWTIPTVCVILAAIAIIYIVIRKKQKMNL